MLPAFRSLSLFGALLLAATGGYAVAQSALPPCPEQGNAPCHKCWGTRLFPDEGLYVGEFLYVMGESLRHGQGIEYRPDGAVGRAGQWAYGQLARPHAIEPGDFPFNPAPTPAR